MPKTNNRSVRENRRKGAEERQVKYESLTTAQKLELVQSRRGNSKREVARLTAALTKEDGK